MDKILLFCVAMVCAIMGIARFFVPTHGLQPEDIYKDGAHLLVALVLGISIGQSQWKWWKNPYGVMFHVLVAIELIAFFGPRIGAL